MPLYDPTASGYAVCQCGNQRLIARRYCGQCPQRRASDTEAFEAYERNELLQSCKRCGHAIMLSTLNPPDFVDGNYMPVLCYECRIACKSERVRCAHPSHGAMVPTVNTDTYKLVSNARKTQGRIYFATACHSCAIKHKLQTREEYLFENADIDPNTGEVLPMREQTGTLTLQADPLAQYGAVWAPERQYRYANGNITRPCAVIVPYRYVYFRTGNTPCRALLCEWSECGTKTHNSGTVWCPALNARLDERTSLGVNSRKRAAVASVGILYCRIIGESEGGALQVYTTFRQDYLRDNPDSDIAEWIQWSHETGE